MKKINKHIEIVRSTISNLNSMGTASSNGALKVLAEYYVRVGITMINNLSDLEALVALKPDLVFLGMEFVPTDPNLGPEDPNKIWITSYLDDHDIAYTGSSQTAHELARNKPMAKQQVLDAGLTTSEFFVVAPNQVNPSHNVPLTYPLFIKPTNRGGGAGIDSKSVVNTSFELDAKVASIAKKFRSDSLVEKYLDGREFSVAILKQEYSAEYSVMPLELIAPQDEYGARILSARIKSADTERFLEVTDEDIKHRISTLAIDVFHALGARDYGRIDIRMDKLGTPYFLEANLIPSLLKGYGNFPKACMLNMDLDYESMLLSIVRLALRRCLDTIYTPYLTVPNMAYSV